MSALLAKNTVDHRQAVRRDLNCHYIASRGVLGQKVFIDMHLIVNAEDLTSAHKITERVETRLDQKFGPVRCTIHLEPRDYVEDGITYSGAHG